MGLPCRCVGLGTEDGVSERDFFANWALLMRQGGYLGSVGWLPQLAAVRRFQEVNHLLQFALMLWSTDAALCLWPIN